MSRVARAGIGRIYLLRIALKGIRPPIWRRIQVPGTIRLADLHAVIQTVFGWTDSHLHQFVIAEQRYGQPDDFDEDVIDESAASLADAVGARVKCFAYTYDFGDNWEHEVVVEKIIAGDSGSERTLCHAGKRHRPPEDCGGAWGYREFLKATDDPDHAEHEARLESIGGKFDPEEFDLAAANRALAALRLPRSWVFGRLGVAWYIGAAAALCITLTLHGIFLHVFNDPERPKQSMHRLRLFASAPAIIGFLVALALIVLARYVAGSLALLLLPLFSLALWLGTLSLLVLAAALFTLAHMLGWSARHEEEYRHYRDEADSSADFLKELQPESDGRSLTILPSHSDSRHFDGRSAALPAIAFLAIALSSVTATGCTPALTATATPTAPASREESTRPAPAPTAGLHIYIDWSGSPIRQGLEEAWTTLRQELPGIAERHRIGVITVSRFDADGWCPRTLVEVHVPTLQEPTRQKLASSEWDSFANFHDALRAEEDRTYKTERAATRASYQRAVAKALQQLDAANVLPPPNQASRNTDIVGLLRRISQMRELAPQFVILLTDLADTRVRRLPPTPEPAGETHALVLLIPADAKDALLTLGRSLSASEQFDVRSQELRESAPWVTIAPHFAHNLASYLKRQCNKHVEHRSSLSKGRILGR